MRNLLAILLLCAALPVAAADRPVNLQPIPDSPPPPPGFELDPALEPQVTMPAGLPFSAPRYSLPRLAIGCGLGMPWRERCAIRLR